MRENAFAPDGAGPRADANRLAPVAVHGGLVFTSLTAGTYDTCGVAWGGAAYCWGYNAEGQLGDGTKTTRLGPTRVIP